MRATLLLADAAQDANGKVHALGLGWSLTSAPTPPIALVALFKVPWTDANRKIPFVIELLDADGHLVALGPPDAFGKSPSLRFEAELEVGRPPGLPHGTPIDAQCTLNLGPLPLESGKAYEFRMSIDGQHKEEWSSPFNTRA